MDRTRTVQTAQIRGTPPGYQPFKGFQGYLAHKKPRLPKPQQYDYA
jgi:hypothetical protein